MNTKGMQNLYAFIGKAASWVVRTYDKSAPTLNELIDAKYGAPVYLISKEIIIIYNKYFYN